MFRLTTHIVGLLSPEQGLVWCIDVILCNISQMSVHECETQSINQIYTGIFKSATLHKAPGG